MLEFLKSKEPLSQVWFVHDYIQIHFQGEMVTILNSPELHLSNGKILRRRDLGFCDALVAQIDQRLGDVVLEEGRACTLFFNNGVKLVIPLTTEAARGPEAIELPTAYIVFNA